MKGEKREKINCKVEIKRIKTKMRKQYLIPFNEPKITFIHINFLMLHRQYYDNVPTKSAYELT